MPYKQGDIEFVNMFLYSQCKEIITVEASTKARRFKSDQNKVIFIDEENYNTLPKRSYVKITKPKHLRFGIILSGIWRYSEKFSMLQKINATYIEENHMLPSNTPGSPNFK